MIFVGRITQTAVVKKIKDGREVVNFSIAINDYYKPKGAAEGTKFTTFYNCSYWVSTKIAPLLTKGSLVEIAGRIYINAYKGFDGEAKASLNCHVNSITIHQQMKTNGVKDKVDKDVIVEDLPF